jgi:hypothetical protein
LLVRFTAPKAVKADLFSGEIDFGTNEAMRPQRINGVAMTQQFDFAAIVGATQENDRSVETELQMERPVFREVSTLRSGVEAGRRATASGIDEPCGAIRQIQEMFVVKSSPDFVLPATVVVLDRRLKTGLSWRSEDGGHAQLKAQPNNASKGIRPPMSALEDRIIVELCVIGKPLFTPVCHQHFHREFGGPGGFDLADAKAAMQADAIQDHDVDPPANDQTFDKVEAIELGLVGGDGWQVPAFGRRGATDSLTSIQCTPTEQDSSDGANRGDMLRATFLQGTMDGGCPKFSEVAGLLELFPQPQDPALHGESGGTSRSSSTARRIAPIHAIQTLAACAPNPILNRRQTHTKFPLNVPQRPASPNRGDHLPPPLFKAVFRSHSVLVNRRLSSPW